VTDQDCPLIGTQHLVQRDSVGHQRADPVAPVGWDR
jgi:hypothetical protein